jgi:hypothetical protein
MLTHYIERLKAHFDGKTAIQRTATWLSQQDNKSGGWDPRPAQTTKA